MGYEVYEQNSFSERRKRLLLFSTPNLVRSEVGGDSLQTSGHTSCFGTRRGGTGRGAEDERVPENVGEVAES